MAPAWLNPDGTVQAVDGIVYGEVSLAAARAKSFGTGARAEKLSARRPELYDNLTLSNYLWNPLEFHGLYDYRPLPSGRRSSVAAAQIAPRPGDYAGNLALIEQALAEVSARSEQRNRTDGDLVVSRSTR